MTIVVILAGTLRAIDPETEAEVQREYRETAVALAVRGELLQDKSVELMSGGDWPAGFSLAYSGPGRAITFRGPGEGTVRDVSVWKLRVLTRLGSVFGRSQPVVQAWPDKPVSAGMPLVTIDAASTWLGRSWARWSVNLRPVRSDRLGTALAALHGETLEHIRAGRPAEAVAGMRALAGLQEVVWQAYAAHGRTYGVYPDHAVPRFGQGTGDLIAELLDDLLRTAAVSGDPAIQLEASALPRVIAREALYKEVAAAVGQALGMLESVYITLAGELSAGGERGLPATGLAQSRLDAPFGSLLSFVNYYLGQAIDQAASGGGTGWDRRRLPPAEFLFYQLRAANEAMLRMLRHAVQYGDSATALRALAAWKLPDLPRAGRAAGLQASASTTGGTEALQPSQSLQQSLDDAETELNAMLLRLFVTVLDADQAARGKALPRAARSAAETADDDGAPDPVAEAILARLPDGSLWHVLETAIRTADGDWTGQAAGDEIIVSGTVTFRSADTAGPLTRAFAVAAIARPRLVAGTVPGELAVDRGQSLIAAADQVLASQEQWLTRHGCPPDIAARNADSLKEQLTDSAHAARAELERDIRISPVRADVTDRVGQLARVVFRERDISGVLFARAGKTAAGGAGLSPVTIAINTDRRLFTSAGDPEWAIDSLGRQLGSGLAALSLRLLALTAAHGTEARPVPRQDAAGAIRQAIEEVSGTYPAGPGRRTTAARTVVLIPDLGYTDRNALQLERAMQNGGLTAAASTALQQFGLEEQGLAAQVPGTIDGVPVIETGLRDRNVVAVDLARFGALRRSVPAGTGQAEPEFALYQAPDPLRAAAGGAPAAVVGDPPDLLQVQVSLSLHAGIEVGDPSAVRVIRLE